jgi:hypothetical protein
LRPVASSRSRAKNRCPRGRQVAAFCGRRLTLC